MKLNHVTLPNKHTISFCVTRVYYDFEEEEFDNVSSEAKVRQMQQN